MRRNSFLGLLNYEKWQKILSLTHSKGGGGVEASWQIMNIFIAFLF